MSTDFDLLLGRALIAAAWADGALDANEREALEDLLLGLDDLDPETWRALHADLDRPITAEHRGHLVEELEVALSDRASRDRAAGILTALHSRLPEASAEAGVLAGIAAALRDAEAHATVRTGFFGHLQEALNGGLDLRSRLLGPAKDSQLAFERTVQARLAAHWPPDEDWPAPDELHRICTGAAILAHVVRLDDVVGVSETAALGQALHEQWGLGPAASRLATDLVLDETAGGLDLHLVLREFQRATTEEERRRFLVAVFTVAAADGLATYDEIEEIRRIARGLLLSHQHFIEAKLQVPTDRRAT